MSEPLSLKRESDLLRASDPYEGLRSYASILESCGVETHFMQSYDHVSGANLEIDGKAYINFSTYNYLGLSNDPRVDDAAKRAIDRYGTSSSASRLVSGQRCVHQELEQEVAEFIGTEDCVAFSSGHATNVSTIDSLYGPQDLILYDILSHNSIQQGIRLSGATALRFSHNSVEHVDRLLTRYRKKFNRALIVTEGVFSMDGDVAPVPAFVDVKRRHDADLMVDEAHSMGVVGQHGRGIVEHFKMDPCDVDIWMGTLSKSLASCGGYIAGSHALVESLRYAAAGFVYSCGMSPSNAAAALEATRILKKEPERVSKLTRNFQLFRKLASDAGLNTGESTESAVIPIILSCSLTAIIASHLLFESGVVAYPLFFPIVPKNAARLRFFMTASHSENDIRKTVDALATAVNKAREFVAAEQLTD